MVMFVQVYYPLSTVLTFEQEILLHVAYFEIHYKQEGTVTVFFITNILCISSLT